MLMKKLFLSFFTIPLLAVISLASCSDKSIPSDKKEIMDRFLAGTLDESYVPAAFFSHYPGRTEGEAAVLAHLEFFLKSDMDILKVQFEQSVPRISGLDTPEAWENLEMIPEDFYRPTLEIVSRLYEITGKNVYVLPTIYNPYQVARQSLREPNIILAAKEHPEELKALLDNYRTALLWLVNECKKIGIEGFYMTTQGGEKKFYELPGNFYETYIRPYDLEIMGECCKDTKMNMLHICDWEGTYDDLTRFKDYPGQIVNTPFNLDGKAFTLQDGVELFGRPVLGGLDRKGEINTLSAEDVGAMIDDVLGNAPKGRTMLGAECTVGSAPVANVNAAVQAAHRRR